jgi:DNA-binding NtrC family response regulator
MPRNSLLKYKRILIVDDDSDVLDTLEELLPICDVVKAPSFDEGKDLLESQYFDMAILDIMGVNGFKLLKIANERNVISVILTANALSVDNTVKAYKEGAASYLPKDKMAEIATFLNDILEAKEKGENFWWRWFTRLGSYYNDKFGPNWQDKDKEFWENFKYFE